MGNKNKSLVGVLIFIAAVAAASTVSYIAVFSRGHIPDFPQAFLDPGGAERSITDLSSRAVLFHPSDEETPIITMLEDLHLAETGEESEEPAMSLEKRVKDLKRALHAVSKIDRPRFFALGDYLAFRFHLALEALLAEKPFKKQDRSIALMRVTLFGGAFYTQAIRRRLINPDHTLNMSKALPEILFRYRWRLWGDFSGIEEFSKFEQKALSDFTVRFVDKREVDRRLKAAVALSKLDPSYDATVAEVLILLDADKKKEALRRLDDAISKGRDDKVIRSFRRAIASRL